MITKARDFVALIPKRPTEAIERLFAAVQARWEVYDSARTHYDSCSLTDALQIVGGAINGNLFEFLAEPGLSELERSVEANWKHVRSSGPFRTAHNGDMGLARLCYCVTRAIQPQTVIETGVCYGVTSSFILEALQRNSKGHLLSIDLPPLHNDGDRFVGRLIPDNVRSRWTLHRGSSRRLLSPLLESAGKIDLFIHDSLHTYRNMKMELGLAWHAIRPGGVLIADDVQSNRAFQELSNAAHAARSIVFAEERKDALCGVMVKPS